MANAGKERDLLRDAVRDLDRELRSLRAGKRSLEKKLGDCSGKLDFVKQQEIRLRNLISVSMRKEDFLQKKRNRLKEKLAALNERMEKVKAVERELKDV